MSYATEELARITKRNPVYKQALDACNKLASRAAPITTARVAYMLGYSPFAMTSIMNRLRSMGFLHEPQIVVAGRNSSKIWQLVTVEAPLVREPVRIEMRTIDGVEHAVKVGPTLHASGALIWGQRLGRSW